MQLDQDTFLCALYTVLDDLYQAEIAIHKPARPGPAPWVSDSEVLTLVVAGRYYGWSARALGRYAAAHWQHLFPRQLSQSAFNRRRRDLAGVLTVLVAAAAQRLGAAAAAYEVIDGVPLVLAQRCRGVRHQRFSEREADLGCGGSDRAWFYGLRVLLAVTPDGVITGFVAGPASTAERWLAEAFFCWRTTPEATPWSAADRPDQSHRAGGGFTGFTGLPWPRRGAGIPATCGRYLADRGFAGQVFGRHWRQAYTARVVTRRDYYPDEAPAHHAHASLRQIVETINGLLSAARGSFTSAAHTLWGVRTDLAAALLTINLGIALNRQFRRPDLALLTLVA